MRKAGRQKRTMMFYIDELKVFDYMLSHNIRYLKDFYEQAGLNMTVMYHSRLQGVLSLENAWKLAEFMGCMIEDVVQVEYIEEENNGNKENKQMGRSDKEC